ncbi:MAG: ribonucleoside reductase [Limnohabitans sp.]|uniref:LAGLIDADG family homing endonuclease n=1 Tax=Limnohabitans sp. TaxID=1907725 RepID=UPI0025D1B87E|nr:LAGLIDADG family homing endonuclease [Limnohabitans sp.]MCO4087499.1 ribonucleoside reductase [Limnohabitans sp.]
MSNNLVSLSPQKISSVILAEKYLKSGENTADDLFVRVARGIAQAEKTPEMREQFAEIFLKMMHDGGVGGGRIMSAAGTDIKATLINCFVQPVGDCIQGLDEDGNPGIYEALREAAETMRRGGGVGYDFSRIRPQGAFVGGTHSEASGPCSYMDVFDKSCGTVESAGARRGAQMGVLRMDHPDVLDFITAKRTPGRWNNFNVSLFVEDNFFEALEAGETWELVHKAKPSDRFVANNPGVRQRADGLWVYREVSAKEMWDTVMKSNYDFAEPGILLGSNFTRENNLWYCEKLEATNPCVTRDTWVTTTDGPRQVKDLIGKKFSAVVNGEGYATVSDGFFETGKKEVFLLRTSKGFDLKLTGNHKVLVKQGSEQVWVEAKNLNAGDKVVLHNHRGFSQWAGKGSWNEGYMLGVLFGDGFVHSSNGVGQISVWTERKDVLDESALSMMATVRKSIRDLKSRSDFKGFSKISGRAEYRLKSRGLGDLAAKFGITSGIKSIPATVEEGSSDFYKGFLCGFFDADGSVQGQQQKGVSVRLSQSSPESLKTVQRMLARLGVISTIYQNRRNNAEMLLPDGKGKKRMYKTKPTHDLVVSGDSLQFFQNQVGFKHHAKAKKLKSLLSSYKRTPNKERFFSEVIDLVSIGNEEVFDVTVNDVHAFDANGLYVHNCAEHPLPKYGCCDLGQIILPKFVSKPFSKDSSFNFDHFKATVKTLVRFLDNVLDVTHWPLEQQRQEAQNKRRIGGGFTGLGSCMAMLGIEYGSADGDDFASSVSCAMRDAAYEASIELAKERGTFPLLDREKYLQSGFANRLPDHIREGIREHGLRNSHLLSIAPVGTVSLAFGDNCSNGVEPMFSLAYMRNKRTADGGKESFAVLDHALRVFIEVGDVSAHVGGDAVAFKQALLDAIVQFKTEFEFDAKSYKVSDVLPKSFVTAQTLSVDQHLSVLAAVQPYIDAAISKTINVPADYPFEDFKGIYLKANKLGLKGVACYRPNAILGSVLVAAPAAPATETKKPEEKVTVSADVDPASVVLTHRPGGDDLQAVVKKVAYSGSTGDSSMYLTVSFASVQGVVGGVNVEVERPVEVFITASPDGVPGEWIAIHARSLSLLARSGVPMLAKALQDGRAVRSDKGRVRYGWYEKDDGTKVPRFPQFRGGLDRLCGPGGTDLQRRPGRRWQSCAHQGTRQTVAIRANRAAYAPREYCSRQLPGRGR